MQTELSFDTPGPGLFEITADVARAIPTRTGLLTLFVRHTSCSLLIQENADPDVQRDLSAFLNRLVPHADDPAMDYLTHRAEGPDDMPAHIKSTLLPVCLQIPVDQGRLMLGTWQGIFLFEHRDRPHHRRVALHFAP